MKEKQTWKAILRLGLTLYTTAGIIGLLLLAIVGKITLGYLPLRGNGESILRCITVIVVLCFVGFWVRSWAKIKLGLKRYPKDIIEFVPDEEHPDTVVVDADKVPNHFTNGYKD